jgi:hypothetical protein
VNPVPTLVEVCRGVAVNMSRNSALSSSKRMEECLGPLLRKVCASSTVMDRYFWLYRVFDVVDVGSWSGRLQGNLFLPLVLEKNTELKSCCKAYIVTVVSVLHKTGEFCEYVPYSLR